MTVSSDICRMDLVQTGTLDTFPFTFEIYTKTDIKVWVSGILKKVDEHYTIPIAGINNPAGGNIVFMGIGNIPPLNAPITILLDLPLTQLVNLKESDKLPAETLEKVFDRLVKIVQTIKQYILTPVPIPVPTSITYLGRLDSDPDTTGWGSSQGFTMWSTKMPDGTYRGKYWSGTEILMF